MADDGFEWDDGKAAENWRRHRVSFAEATLAIGDPFAIEWLDTREAYGEERVVLVGMSQGPPPHCRLHPKGRASAHHFCSEGHEA